MEGTATFDISKCPEQGEMSEECKKAREEEAKAKAEKEKMAPKPGGSGCSGHK